MTYLKRQDWILNFSILFLAIASLITIYSSTSELFWQQLIWFAAVFIVIFLSVQIDWRTIVNYRWMIFGFYFFVVILLVATLLFAPVIRQTKGWLVIGPFQFQPSELAKVVLIVILAYFFSKRHVGIADVKNLIVSFVYFLIPAAIIFFQPDWGSALIMLGLWSGFILISGLKWKHLSVGLIILMLFGVLSWNFLLQGYQKERIVGFLQPTYDPLGINYSVIQSKIAIGSAGLFGKGFKQGTQTQLGFLTEPATDFILAAFIEEFGFLGGFLIISVFLLIIFRIILAGIKSENNFIKFVSLGTAVLFLLEFIFNVGSNLALLPVVGITFPFFSYGGSSLLTKAILIGIIQGNVSRI